MKRLTTIVGVLSVLALLVAACGGGKDATATPAPTATRPAAATATTAPQVTAAATATARPAGTATAAPQATPTTGAVATPTAVRTPTPTPTATAAGAAPKYGGTITGFATSDILNFDLVSDSQGSNLALEGGLYNGLIQYCPMGAGAANEVCPDLAKSWAFSADGSKLILQLNTGVKWHDGTPFSASDAVFTLSRMLDPNQASPISGTLIRPYVESASAPDPNTVVLNLKASSLSVVPTLASGWFVVMAKHVWDKDKAYNANNMMGTGPFKFKVHEKGTRFELQKNTSYFNSQWPYLDSKVYLIISDASTYSAAFRLGRVQLPHYYNGFNVATWNDLKKELGDKITGSLGPTLTTVGYLTNHNVKPFDDPRVRRALRISIDMHEIIEKNFYGAGVAGAVLDPEGHGEFALPYDQIKNLPGVRKPTADDLAEARKLLADAGFPNGFTVKMLYNSSTVDAESAVAMVIAQLKRIGVTAEPIAKDTRIIYSDMAKGDYIFAPIIPRGTFTSDPQSAFTTYYTKDAILNYSHYVDPVLDKLYNDQFSTLDQKKRVQAIQDFQRQVLKFEGATSTMRWDRTVKGTWSYVKNHRFGLSVYDGWTFERVWMDK